MDNQVELLASYWTISGARPHTDHEHSPFSFKDRVEAAAKAGFTGLGIWHADLARVREQLGLKEMKRILDDSGIKHVELEFLTDWFLGGDRRQKSDARRQELLEAAEVLRAHHIKVGDFYHEQVSMQHLIEDFATLCKQGRDHGTKIGFELMPFAMIDNIPDAVTLVREAGEDNGGITLDLWHIAKLKIPYAEVAKVPLSRIMSVELNDGTYEAPWGLHEDTINHRYLCGEGEFDVRGFVQCLQNMGHAGPWGVEVLSEELRALPLSDMTQRAFGTTMAQFQA